MHPPCRIHPVSNRFIYLPQASLLQLAKSDDDIPSQRLTFTFGEAPSPCVTRPRQSGVHCCTPTGGPAANVHLRACTDGARPAMAGSTGYRVRASHSPSGASRLWSRCGVAREQGPASRGKHVVRHPVGPLGKQPPRAATKTPQRLHRLRVPA